jgi:FKBP-type peptidyl-prolyl cis-trans isomerase
LTSFLFIFAQNFPHKTMLNHQPKYLASIYLLFFSVAILTLSSCGNNMLADDVVGKLAENETAIQKYITDNKLTTTKTASGLQYVIQTKNGAGLQANIGDEVSFHYQIRVIGGNLLDSSDRVKNTPLVFKYGINRLITGIEEAVSILKSGEKGLFLMNNTLAYGSQSDTNLPAYAALAANIQIVNIRNEDRQIDDYIATQKLKVTEKTTTGLRYIRTTEGTGGVVASGQNITLKYVGKFLNDKQFDAGELAAQVGGGRFIKGFEEGFAKMKIGEKATLIFPSAVGYGTAGTSTIAPYSPLIFEIEIVK